MATAGIINPNYGSSWVFFGFNTDNNVGIDIQFPESGTITAVSFNCAALSGSGSGMQANGCVWNSSGTLIGNGGTVSLPYRAAGAGPYAWQTSGGLSLHVVWGAVIRIGWWRSPQSAAGDNLWGYGSGGTEFRGTTAGSTGPGIFPQDASSNRQIGCYVTYTPDATPPPIPPAPPPPISNPSGFSMTQVNSLRKRGLLP